MLYILRIARQAYYQALGFPGAVELPQGHIPALDAVRGLAIVLVMLYRFGGGTDGPGRAVVTHGLSYLGTRGVDLFFVLSGFLITGILFDAKAQANYFLNFYMRRVLRIFPLYYAALLLTLVVIPRTIPSLAGDFQPAIDNQAWLWLYGANIVQGIRGSWCLGPLNHFWSLAVEEHFYFVWPVVIYLASRKNAMRICACVVGVSALSRMAWLAGGGNDVAAEVLTPLRMDSLALGGWVALAARGPRGLEWLSFRALPAFVAAGCLAAVMLAFNKRHLGLPFLTWAVAFAAFLVLMVAAAPKSALGRFGSSRLLQFFGKYSYAMYVFQLPLVMLAAPLVTAPGLAATFGWAWLGQLVYCGLMFAIATILAFMSWHCFEKHVLALKHHFG